MQLPEDDKHTYTREYLEAMLAVLMGRAVRRRKFFSATSPPGRRQRYRTRHGHRGAIWSCEWGMSELGPLAYGKKDEAIFPGPRNRSATRLFRRHRHPDRQGSESASSTAAMRRPKHLLAKNRDTLERIAQALLEREVIDANEVKLLMEGKPLPEKPRTSSHAAAAGRAGHRPESSASGAAASPGIYAR